MSKINKAKLKQMKKENRIVLAKEFKELNLKRKEEKRQQKISRKEFSKILKADKSNLIQYKKEIKEFEKKGKLDCDQRISDVKKWYSTIKKNSSNKKVYKYRLQRAKNVAYDYSGDIKFENVSYIYSRNTPFEFKALSGTDLVIDKGKITAIIGTTGSGKSTLIQLANGLIVSETGRTIIGDFQIPGRSKKISQIKPLRREIGLVFQFPEYQLFQESIEKDIAFGPLNMGISKEEVEAKIPELLDMVFLPRDYASRSPFALSGGQKRRVAIAGIIAMDGNTLVLDEPTGGLDPQGEDDFMKLFHTLNKDQGKRIIIVTHNMDHVLKIADDVIVMSQGKVIKKGTPFEIFGDSELLKFIEIEPPKVYQLAHKLKEKGIDITDKEFRTLDEFAQELKKKRGK